MAFLGNLPIFDHKVSEWLIFKGKLTQFIKINSVKEENQSGILLTHLDEESYRLLRNLAYPLELDTLGFTRLIELLDSHFKPRQGSFVDKAIFYGASRSPGEKLGDWAARLRGLASYCDFGTALETNLRDRFVLGLGAGPERDKLFEQNASTLTLTRAIELAEQAACAKQAKVMCKEESAILKEEPILRAKFQTGRGDQQRPGAARGDVADISCRCLVCGLKNHTSDKCRYKTYKCQKCGVKGHLKKVCTAAKKSSDHQIHHCNSTMEYQAPENIALNCEECQNFNLRYVTDKPILIDVCLGGKIISMELDSGSGNSVISEKLYEKYFSTYKLHQSYLRMCLYDGSKIIPLGYFTIEVFYSNTKKQLKIFVVRNGGPPLLGRDFMSAFNLVITSGLCSVTNKNELEQLLAKFSNLWRDELGAFNKFKVKLQLKDNSNPKYFKPRSVPFALREKVEQEIDRLVKLGILVPVNHSDYATPIVPVLKSDGQVKIAGDFSITLNKDLIIDKYPLPRIEEVFAKIGGGERYSKIDLKNAYNQFLLEESSQDLTTINTHKGLFKYTRLVYGLANAPAIFQKSMESLLSGIKGVSVWLDDICITGSDSDIHLKRLHEVLSRLNDAGLRLQKEKCEFFKESVQYLGYVISKEGLQTCPDKVKAILNAPDPTNVSEVKRFLGVVNYYRNFIPNASSLLNPLHELLRSDVPWEWGERQRRSMAAVRRELASERVLAHFDPAARLVLSVDAGPAGLGAVLAQRAADGAERPLAYASRSLAASERNYSQIQKEATAIIFGVKRFHQYLYGRDDPFILKTDHRPLVSIFNNKSGIPITTALRLQRYAIILSAYNYTVQYVSSENNAVADFFSRAPLQVKSIDENGKDVDSLYALKFLDAASPATALKDIILATQQDETIMTVVKYLQYGWPRKISCTSVLPYFQCKSDLQFENGCLLRGHRIVIPSKLRNKMLQELHDSHLGITKSKSNARSRMWWPGIDGDIERWVGACAACVAARGAPPRDPPAPWPAAARPWQRIHIDYMTIGQRVYLVVVDSHSKWLECLYMHNGTSTTALITKLKVLFATFGIPDVLVSDNDTKINSLKFRSFCSANGIKYMTSPIYHPPSNGQAENSVRTCKKMLKCILKENLSLCEIQEHLLGYLFNYRNAVHCTTGETPAKLMFGRKLRTRLDLILPSEREHSSVPVPGRRSFGIGDKVWCRWYSARMETWQLGIIKEKVGNKMYKIFIDSLDEYCIRHVDQLLNYTGGENEVADGHLLDDVSFSSPVTAVSSQEPAAITQSDETQMSSQPQHVTNNRDREVGRDCEEEESERIIEIENDSSAEHSSEQVQGVSSDATVVDPPETLTRPRRNVPRVDYRKYL
ncbi:uncharacterized protein K02A2.6-like [Amyelois transitella]|uniref:uncharacterized protein K02A2.6-like n=2 Tax=Amyelois transitella TaxID=680683 RepID=UPI00298F47C8|nr:uncharacterized protein K02A2.6-like [Amyelois transitella]